MQSLATQFVNGVLDVSLVLAQAETNDPAATLEQLLTNDPIATVVLVLGAVLTTVAMAVGGYLAAGAVADVFTTDRTGPSHRPGAR